MNNEPNPDHGVAYKKKKDIKSKHEANKILEEKSKEMCNNSNK